MSLKNYVVLICVVCMARGCLGAEKLEASLIKQLLQEHQALPTHPARRHLLQLPVQELGERLSLDKDTRLDVVQSAVTVQGNRLLRLQELYKGRAVLDGVVTLEMDKQQKHVIDVSGTVYRHIDVEFDDEDEIDADAALNVCVKHHHDQHNRHSIVQTKIEQQVLFDDTDKAYPAYLVQYFVTVPGATRQPTCILNARNSRVTLSWDAIDTCTDCSASGIGGNLKIGKIRYGELHRCLNLRRENDRCYLENQYVRVIDNHFTMNIFTDDEAASYNCQQIDDEINGAYSPLLDALFYGTVVGRMLEVWYNMTPPGDKMFFRVHFGENFDNAFSVGIETAYGDGSETYSHPLVSLDIIGHEVGHSVTMYNSDLFYFDQSGGINEAFSDIMGETVEAYLKEDADWLQGFDIAKEGTEPLRYFANPEKDNVSISHADNYTSGMNVHFSSGVYNKAFYLMVHEYGLPIKEVFHAFLLANQMYWHSMSDFERAACDVMKSAYDLGQDGGKFRTAFAEVGIEACDAKDHIMFLKKGESYTDITVSRDISPAFEFIVHGQFAVSAKVKASSSLGTVHIVLSNKTWGQEDDFVSVYAEGLDYVEFDVAFNSSVFVSITLSTRSTVALTDVTLSATYTCTEGFRYKGDTDRETYETFYLWLTTCDEFESGEKEEPETSGDDDTDKEKGCLEDDEDDKGCVKSISLSGHVFNFFKSFVVMFFVPAN